MRVNDEIAKTREKYRQKRVAPSSEKVKRIEAPRGDVKEYFTIFFNIMKREILFKLGIQKPEDKRIEEKKQEYYDFMEMYFK